MHKVGRSVDWSEMNWQSKKSSFWSGREKQSSALILNDFPLIHHLSDQIKNYIYQVACQNAVDV